MEYTVGTINVDLAIQIILKKKIVWYLKYATSAF